MSDFGILQVDAQELPLGKTIHTINVCCCEGRIRGAGENEILYISRFRRSEILRLMWI
jgi:hypothetical protein